MKTADHSLSFATSAEAHARLPHANPLTTRQLGWLTAKVAGFKPATVLDVGTGPGTAATRIAALCPAEVTAIDVNPFFLERAREFAAGQRLAGRANFLELAAARLPIRARFHAVICLGASQAIGTPLESLAWCRTRLSKKGVLLFGDITWREKPSPEFLRFLGTEESHYWFEHEEGNIFAQAGFRVRALRRASLKAWHSYEKAVHAGRLRFAKTLPSEQAAAVRKKALAWRKAYDTYGQRYLGFTAYVATPY